ncbi:MAG: hypothetical protein ABI282_07075 [Candidatus Baltobacteraceae bacterium]
MLQNVTASPNRRALEFGIYRDGDNNLDASQSLTIPQALQTSEQNPGIQFTVQDTTGLREAHGDIVEGKTRTDSFTITDGQIAQVQLDKAHDMADPENLAAFVAHTLDNAEASSAKQTWVDLVDHGGGDGGGLETHDGHLMSMPDIAKAIADGVKMHAQEHPEDATRTIDGVVANQCLMSTMGFADALSRDGVKWLAASPETMLSPGVPSTVADGISKNVDNPDAMAKAVVKSVMRAKFGGDGDAYGPAAAFDVLDLDKTKIANAEGAIKSLNDAIGAAGANASVRRDIRSDVKSVDGMVRFPGATSDMPWHADRPALAVYASLANDDRLGNAIRKDAQAAADGVRALVMAHAESRDFAPFGGADYRDAAGPTIHAPVNAKQVNPWAPTVNETDNAFYNAVDQGKFVRAIA